MPDGKAHIDLWRAEAYRRGVSSSIEQEAKKKAFQRALGNLLDSGHIETDSDHYWPSSTIGTKRDISGTCPGCTGTTRDTLLKECPDVPTGSDSERPGIQKEEVRLR